MPRRASRTLSPAWFLAAIALLVVVVAAGKFVLGRLDDPYRTVPDLDVPAYLENSDALRGNVYKVECRIDSALAWSPLRGRLVSVEVVDGSSAILPLLVPSDLSEVNVQKGQVFEVQIEVVEHGVLVARDMRKS